MKFLLVTLIMSASIQAYAQNRNQNSVIVGGALLNILKLPEELIFGVTAPFKINKYNKLAEKTLAEKKEVKEALTCEEKCADDFSILSDKMQRMHADKGENLLSFLNEKSDFADHIQRTVGYCWGHTSTTRTFNYLATFDAEEAFEKAPSRSDEKEFSKFYKKKIKNIMNYKAQIIPGFKNLREFSADPVIMRLLKDKVVWQWADQTLRFRSAGVFTKGQLRFMSNEKVENFLKEIEERLKVNHSPKVFFTNLKSPAFIHIVNVNEVRRESETKVKMCILDNHEYEEDLKDCGRFVSIDFEKDEYFYSGWDDPKRNLEGFVGQFGFTPEDRIEMVNYQKENRKMCLKLCEQSSN